MVEVIDISADVSAAASRRFLQLCQLAFDLDEAANQEEDISEMNAPGKNVRRVQMLKAANCIH